MSDKVNELRELCEKHRLKDIKPFLGAIPYDNDKVAQVSSQYQFEGMSTCYIHNGDLKSMYILGKESLIFKEN